MKRRRLTLVDLKKEFNLLKDSTGFNWAALRCAQLDEKCIECSKSVGSQYSQPDPNCVTCLGTGHTFVDKIVKLRSSSRIAANKFMFEMGATHTDTKNFFLETRTVPKNTDYITELFLDETTGAPVLPFKIRQVYKIQNVYTPKGILGVSKFSHCIAEKRNFHVGRSIIAKPLAKTAAPALTYYIRMILINRETVLDIDPGLKFRYVDIDNVNNKMALVPRTIPPVGKLLYNKIDNTTTKILIHSRPRR
jgi:hypothetical protein